MGIDWNSLLVPKVSVLELMLRGTAIYLGLFLLLRVLVRRHVGALSLTDLLVIVLIADAAQNAMASDYRSLPEGLVLCATIVGWSFLLDWLSFRSKWFASWVEPKPLPLIRDGKLQRRNLRAEFVTVDEIMSHLRQHGIEELSEVREAYLEPDGQVSILKAETSQADQEEQPKKKRALG